MVRLVAPPRYGSNLVAFSSSKKCGMHSPKEKDWGEGNDFAHTLVSIPRLKARALTSPMLTSLSPGEGLRYGRIYRHFGMLLQFRTLRDTLNQDDGRKPVACPLNRSITLARRPLPAQAETQKGSF